MRRCLGLVAVLANSSVPLQLWNHFSPYFLPFWNITTSSQPEHRSYLWSLSFSDSHIPSVLTFCLFYFLNNSQFQIPPIDLFRTSISLPFWLEISNRICGLPYCSHIPKILSILQLETECDILLLKMIQCFLINKKMVSKLLKMVHNALHDWPSTLSLYLHSSCM